MKVEPAAVDPLRVLNLVAASGCSSYDLQFVTLAEDLGVPLVTADKQVVAAFPDRTMNLLNG